MNTLDTSIETLKKTVSSLFVVLALGGTPLCAQMLTSESLGDLIATNGSLTIGDKTFSNFSFVASGLNTNPDNLTVQVSLQNGADVLSFVGPTAVNNLTGNNSVIGDLELGYSVVATGGLIASIDQSVTPNAMQVPGNQILIGETVGNGNGETVADSNLSLSPSDLSDPSSEPGDNLTLTLGLSNISVTTDILVAAGPDQLVGLSVLNQSFHQVGAATPEPSTWMLLIGGIGALAWFQRRRLVGTR